MKVELAEDIRNNKALTTVSTASELFPSKKEFAARLRRTITWCFGIDGTGVAHDTQIRFCDATTHLVLIRGSRPHCDRICSALTLLLTRDQLLFLGEKTLYNESKKSDNYYASVISVHGSVRTAKIAMFRKVRELYRLELLNNGKFEKRLCRDLQERLTMIQNNLN